jgi:DNA repair protein RecO (recombination protein O)
MIHKTRGIVLHTIKYSETSVIAKIYTEKFGLVSFMIKGARKQKSKIRTAILQPLTLVDLETYFKEKSNLQTLKEITQSTAFSSIPNDIRKNSIVLFIAEILYKTIKEEESNPGLFNYIFNSIEFLDEMEMGIGNFHLHFIIHLTKHLGFYPQEKFTQQKCFFDLEEGTFVTQTPYHLNFLDVHESELLFRFLASTAETLEMIKLSQFVRSELINKILIYYKLHLPGMGEIKSHQVLSTVLE